MKINKKFNRVDMQVSILTEIIVIISSSCVYFFNYQLTYNDMIYTLSESSRRIYEYAEKNIDKDTFTEINSKEDQSKNSYKSSKTLLESIKNTTGVMYLYTAKKTKDGSLVYVVDGLDSSRSDFRNAGDLIEKEIWGDLNKALDNNILLPKKIKATSWGYIFISYFPIHNNDGEVVGVIGIEFEANHQYNTFKFISIVTPLIALLTCLISALVAVVLFKRISNPTYTDFANTDYLTGLKNRNAFEIDMNNLNNLSIKKLISIISIDLDGLKKINDKFGHQTGDLYIKHASKIIRDVIAKKHVVYRVGGDEYIVILKNSSHEEINTIINNINLKIIEENSTNELKLSMSIGYAVFDDKLDVSLFDTYHRADSQMYDNKRKFKTRD
ncbi:GGDEF domain-containing protein [Clostridioides sp. GD02377]|uniref:GGDEF domain-containing protein n=1 Tax=unclassified Clostridioides TaxID=2635829 RepID=UPI0038AC07DD